MAEPANPTTTTELDAAILDMIAEETILANAQLLRWNYAASVRKGGAIGSAVRFPIMNAIAVQTTALPAASNPAPVQLTDTYATITPTEYGLPVELAKELIRQSQAQVQRDAISVITQNMAETRDALAGIAAVGGSTVRFAAGRANAAALTSADVVTRAEIVRARTALATALAPRFPDGTYYAFIHPNVNGDLLGSGANAGDFVDVSKYAAPEFQRAGEIGRWNGFTFFEASQRTYDDLSAGVANVADRHLSVFCGAGFLGYAEGVEPAVFPAFEANDRLQRFLNFGWKGVFGYGRVKETNGYRIESRSAYATAP